MTAGWLAALLLSFQILTTAPQQQQAPAAKGSIEGVVVRAVSGEPLSRAEVKLIRVLSESEIREVASKLNGLDSPPSVLTENDGKFVFKDIDAGQYRLSAARNGYAEQTYGQKAPNERETIVSVNPGQPVKDITFRLVQGGVVTGRVRDAAGEPVVGLAVSLMRSMYDDSGRKTLSSIELGETDDRGEYRFYWIRPGRYYVMASRLEAYRSRVIVDRPLPRVFYPGILDPESASILEVQPGAELNGIDIVIPNVSGYRVTGRLIEASTGKPPKNASIEIVSKKQASMVVRDNGESSSVQYNSATGAFQIRNVLPGSYWLSASARSNFDEPLSADRLSADRLSEVRTAEDLLRFAFNPGASGLTTIEIAGSDLNDVVLTLNKGFSIPVRVSIEGQDLAGLKGSDSIRVTLEGKTVPGHWHIGSRVSADGIGRIDDVMPSEYKASVAHEGAQDFYVKEILYGRADALNDSVLISDQAPATFTVLLSTKVGQVEGTLTDSQSQPVGGAEVVLIPDRRDQPRLFRSATTDTDGRFVFRGLDPGGYKIFSWESLEPRAYYDNEVLSRYEALGRSVRIQESSKETVDLKIIPAPKP